MYFYKKLSLFILNIIILGIGCSFINMDKKMQIESSEILRSFQREGGVVNGTLLVAEGERVVISKGFGMADRESNQNNSEKTR